MSPGRARAPHLQHEDHARRDRSGHPPRFGTAWKDRMMSRNVVSSEYHQLMSTCEGCPYPDTCLHFARCVFKTK